MPSTYNGDDLATMVIVDTSVFSRRTQELLSDDEYLDLQDALAT
ncbi:MAG: hypothetical protein ACREWG_08100 [Gammaproteobacteria bacterium]